MFEKEVNYQLAKGLVLNMEKKGIITAEEFHFAYGNYNRWYDGSISD